MIKSTKLLSILKDILNKDNIQEKDLKEVKDITLNKKLLNGKENDIDLTELELLPNLKTLTIINFYIDKKIIDIINKKKLLWAVQFTKCKFQTAEQINNDIKYLIVEQCENFEPILINNNEIIRIIGENIDLNLLKSNEAKQLYLQECNIKNSEKILEYRNLKYLNLDGSKIDKDIIEKIKEDIQISNKDKYYHLED